MSESERRTAEVDAPAPVQETRDARLRAEAVAREEHIAELDARAIVRDSRIIDLVKEVEGLQAARESAAVIEQAKGVIMSTLHCGPDAAFAVLVAQSQAENRKREIAAEIAARQDRSASQG